MFDLRLLLVCFDSLQLQEFVADVAQVCAHHVANRYYEFDGFDKPLFVKTFEETFDATLALLEDSVDEEIPF